MNVSREALRSRSETERQARIDLAACHRLAARFGFNEGIDNHLTMLVPGRSERLARALGAKSVLMLRNHGVLVIGASAAQAFERLYFLERACQAQILALSSGRKLHVLPQAVVQATATQFRAGDKVGGEERTELHFKALKRLV